MARPSHAARSAKRRAYLERMARLFGTSPETVERRLSHEPRPSVRLNPLRADPAVTLPRLEALGAQLEPVPWCENGFHLVSDKRTVVDSPLFADGSVYVQNASSFLPPLALDPRPGDAILDVASAPGGKASHLAALVANDAELWLNDPIHPRATKLQSMMDTYGVRYSELTEHPGQYVDKFVDATFDRVLLDAQCSGEGMLDLSHPDALRYWSMARVEKYSRLQQRMLVSAFKLVRPGGTLVYSTCTFGPEENEHPVDHLLRHRADADTAPIDIDVPGRGPGMKSWREQTFDARLRDAVRVEPSEFFEGFFVCKLVKRP
ncbi:MAG: RsmB/NOP family class I SAM-dependent RNA methyltransferase [Actinobacteria bacterium]|nr:RsmB/NOP family class I SAM-dependent RNA methyltransferase [Actinomycetota bacterium]